MSLLEDIYVEDDVEMPGDLERIVEGDDEGQEDRNSGDDDENDRNSLSEAEEDKPRKVNPEAEKKAKVVRNPRFVLNPARLMGPRGIKTIEGFFKDFKFRGKDHEKEDLDMVMKTLEHWSHRLYPKFQFDDCLDKIASLGNKKIIQVHMRKIRLNMLFEDDGIVRQCDSDNEEGETATKPPAMDEFDILLEQQIALARSTPATNMKNNSFNNQATPNSTNKTSSVVNNSFNNFSTPKTPMAAPSMTEEQKARMMKNRLLAEERRLARMKENMAKEKTAEDSNVRTEVTENLNVTNLDNTVEEKISNINSDDRIVDRVFENGVEHRGTNDDIIGIENQGSTEIDHVDEHTNDLGVNDKSSDVSKTNNEFLNAEKFDKNVDIDTEAVGIPIANANKESDGCNGGTRSDNEEEMMDVDDFVLNLSGDE